MSKSHKHSKLISEWASNPSGYVIWMAYGSGVDFTWVEAQTPCDWNESVQYKLVPLVKKEKRWIGVYGKHVTENHFGSKSEVEKHVNGSPVYSNCARNWWQFIEIEVEV